MPKWFKREKKASTSNTMIDWTRFDFDKFLFLLSATFTSLPVEINRLSDLHKCLFRFNKFWFSLCTQNDVYVWRYIPRTSSKYFIRPLSARFRYHTLSNVFLDFSNFATFISNEVAFCSSWHSPSIRFSFWNILRIRKIEAVTQILK